MERRCNMDEFLTNIDDVTFKAYLECRDIIGVSEIRIFTEIFNRLKNDHLTFGKAVLGQDIVFAVKFSNGENIPSLDINKDVEEDKDKLFLESAKMLVCVLTRLNEDDRLGLNRLFDGVHTLKRSIGEKQVGTNCDYYPIKFGAIDNKVK